MSKYVVWFSEIDRNDIALVGGKGANLGEMTKAKFPVPAGFIVTVEAYNHFLKENNLIADIRKILYGLDTADGRNLNAVSAKVKKLIKSKPIPKKIAVEIADYYDKLSQHHTSLQSKKGLTKLLSSFKFANVAVRSSATAEDLPEASFAGQQATYLNVQGDANLLNKVRDCWASLFEPRAIFYRQHHHFDHFKVGIAVPVQKMVNSDASGVMFTIDPVTADKKKIIIEAIYGLGELIVQGIETPDQYVVDKYHGDIISRKISTQETIMVKKGTKNVILKIATSDRQKQKISNKDILQLAILGKKLEKHYFFPQDIEWAIENGQIFIVQTRPVTHVGTVTKQLIVNPKNITIIATGTGASPGIASGTVKIISSASQIHKIQRGDILTAEQTSPDFVPAMKKAAAIITEKGGRTSHAAIVSRELGIPAVVGAANILTTLKNNMVVTVDGQKGLIYQSRDTVNSYQQVNTKQKLVIPDQLPQTATKVYLNLAEPDKAQEYSKFPVDGVGLLRAEFMIADIGIHPKKLIKENKQKILIDKLTLGIKTICESFAPRPVVYRTTDFKTNEYRNLRGGKEYEPQEPNPMLGFRGASRYIAENSVFEMELKVINIIRNKFGLKNLWLMIPFVRTPQELLKVKRIMAAANLMRSPSFKLWMMVEIPSNVILLDKFIDCGIDGVSIGSNDLTMLILGTDRDNQEVAHTYDERNDAVLWAMQKTILTCHRRGITSSICGQAPSDYKDTVENLVKWGITSISVNPDALVNVKNTIYEAEKKI